MWTLPQWDSLVTKHMASHNTSMWHAVALLLAFGALFHVHRCTNVLDALACILAKSFAGFPALYGVMACLQHADRLISEYACIMPLTSCMHSSQHPSYVPANHQQSSFLPTHYL
jgi:hypothetical protein